VQEREGRGPVLEGARWGGRATRRGRGQEGGRGLEPIEGRRRWEKEGKKEKEKKEKEKEKKKKENRKRKIREENREGIYKIRRISRKIRRRGFFVDFSVFRTSAGFSGRR
jgi:hypothetical protein